MWRPTESSQAYMAIGLLLGMVFAAPVQAVDGVIEINQASVKVAGGFPFVISQSGSYRLTSNLDVTVAGMQKGGTAPENTTAIQVTADDVTIDLNGFTIKGPTVCSGTPVTSCSPSGTGKGIDGGALIGLAVINGTVRGMGNTAISSLGASLVEKVSAESNGADGIAGANMVVNCNATSNGGTGIRGNTLINCTAFFNGDKGIAAYTVSGSSVISNRAGGIDAITAANCTATSNGYTGIAANTVSASTALNNCLSGCGASDHGINADTATGCTANGNGGSPQILATGIKGQNICNGVPCP